MLVHSGERPYKCSVCGQTFTTNGNMHRCARPRTPEGWGRGDSVTLPDLCL